VFTVSSKARIHSGVYHIQFDAKDPEMKFVLPRPVPVPRDHKPGTLIVLPFQEHPAEKAIPDLGEQLVRFLIDFKVSP
jgi:hypothetical protein